MKRMGAPLGNHNHRKHGMRGTRIYNIWRSMRQRCRDPKQIRYARYGGRGISVCDEWNDFMNFYKWAIAAGYRDDLTIDRINTNGNYEPSNCRWATQKEQQNNRSNNSRITVNGITHTAAEWADILHIKKCNVHSHYERGNAEEYILSKLQPG